MGNDEAEVPFAYRPFLSPTATDSPAAEVEEDIAASTFSLLSFRRRIVPFVDEGRGGALRSLLEWCGDGSGEPPVSVGLLSGKAGAGKSRLAAELCERLRERGPSRSSSEDGGSDAAPESQTAWRAGFAAPDVDWETATADARPLLLVFDEADARTEAVAACIERLTTRRSGPEGSVPRRSVRVLLIARSRGAWFDALRESASEAATAALDDLECLDLSPDRTGEAAEGQTRPAGEVPGAFGPAARREHYSRAVAAYRRRVAQDADADPLGEAPALDHDAFDTPLTIHVAALLAAYGESLPTAEGVPDLRGAMLNLLLAQEEKRWKREAEAAARKRRPSLLELADHDAALVWRMLMLVTLTSPTVAECADLLPAVAGIQSADDRRSRIWRESLAKAMHALYPNPALDGEVVAPVEPGLVAAHLLNQMLGDAPSGSAPGSVELMSSLFTLNALSERSLDRIFGALVDAVDCCPRLADQFAERLADAEREVRGDSRRLLGVNAVRAAPRVPFPHPRLDRLSIQLGQIAVRHVRSLKPDAPGIDRSNLAVLLSDLGDRLGEVGDRSEAMAVSREAVSVRRQLVADSPDS